MSKRIDNPTLHHPDLAKTNSSVWNTFRNNLASVLSKLEEGQYLVIQAKNCNRYIQFACYGDQQIRAEVSSNHFLKGEDRLSRGQTAWLRKYGWHAPTRKKDRQGSPNYFVDLPATVAANDTAQRAVEALAYGLEIPNPDSLTYDACNDSGTTLRFDELGLERSRPDVNMMEPESMDPMEAAFEDPDCPDEDDPEFEDSIWAFAKYRGDKPEDFRDPKDRASYSAYLAKHANDAD